MESQNFFMETAEKIKSFGFEVWIFSDGTYNYGYATDGKHVGYFQQDVFPGQIVFSTCHKPNKNWGTGFSCQDPYNGVFEITKQDVLDSFKVPFAWNGKVVHVKPYSNFSEFMADKANSDSLVKL